MHRMSTRTFVTESRDAGKPLASWLADQLRLTRDAVVRLIREQRVRIAGVVGLDPDRRLLAGQRVEVRLPSAEGPSRPSAPQPKIVHVDEQIVVVDKPSGLTTMRHPEDVAEFGRRARRFLPTTLADLLPGLLPPSRRGRTPPVRAVHRLDKETSGLVVFARTPEAESSLGKQFRAHSTERLYRAIVRGRARDARIESWLIDDRGDGRRGSGPQGQGQQGVTHVRVVEELGDFTLVECRLETGRTHQVRIHLGEAGTPLCGERIYDRPLNGRPLPDASGAKRVALHAALLGFDHPADGRRVRWASPLPNDMEALVRRLRRDGASEIEPH
jgi:23S rRNA pseudouridine1911/1915/1917 synthase